MTTFSVTLFFLLVSTNSCDQLRKKTENIAMMLYKLSNNTFKYFLLCCQAQEIAS